MPEPTANPPSHTQVRPGALHEVKEYSSFPDQPHIPLTVASRIARATGSIILSSGGVIRGITNWGTFLLPKPTRKHQTRYHSGHYFVMRFDSSGKAQNMVRTTLGLDPRMIKFGVVRLGKTLDEIKDVPGKVEWVKGQTDGAEERY